jgi:hypothetical protein
MDTLSLEF